MSTRTTCVWCGREGTVHTHFAPPDRFECLPCKTTFYSADALLLHNLEKHPSCSWRGRKCGDCARWLHRTREEQVTLNGEEQTIEVTLLSVCRIHKHQVLATDEACGPEFAPK